jgi:molecular chaperone GrpE
MKEDVLEQATDQQELEQTAAEETQQEQPEVTIESLTAERDRLFDQLQRSVAEFQNYRRRHEQDQLKFREIATRDVLKAMLPVVDDLQRAIAALPPDQRESGIGGGLLAIERKFLGVLERYGATPVGAVGEAFDPAVHEAVATDETGGQTAVVEVYQTGYRQGNAVLRPAMVKVGSEPKVVA